MGYSFEFDSANNILRCSFEGQITGDETLKAESVLRKLAEAHSSRKGIGDFSRVTQLDLSSQTIERIARMPSIFSGAGSLVVFVAPKDHVYGQARMFMILAEESRPSLRVVHSMEEKKCLLTTPSLLSRAPDSNPLRKMRKTAQHFHVSMCSME